MEGFSLPPPNELGFAPKFIDWRPEQLDGINFAIDQFERGKRVVAISAPTGSGKSLLAMTVAQLTPGVRRAVYLTSTKGLEDQVEEDFRNVGAFDIRGQKNYPCLALDTGGEHHKLARGGGFRKSVAGCDEGPCHFGVSCSLAPERGNSPSSPQPACAYYGAVWSARRSGLVVTNYAYWLSMNRHGGGLGDFDLLILDEGHNADAELERFLTFELDEEDAWRGRVMLPATDALPVWRDWANKALPALKDMVDETAKPDTAWAMDEIRQLKETHTRFETLAGIEPEHWVIERTATGAKFSPIRVGKYRHALLGDIPKVLILSATLTRKAVSRLGIANKDYGFIELPSSFPVERRPVRLITAAPAVWVDSKHNTEGDFDLWRLRIDNLIRPRIAKGSGIIHTVSYKRAKHLVRTSQFRDRMIMPADSRGTIEAVEKFKNSTEPVILVSPAVHTGYDFPYDAARWQIIGKLPFPDSRGPIMEARTKDDKEYFAFSTAATLQQMAGRIVRAEDDWGETLIVDNNMSWFVNRYGYLFTRSFLDSYEELSYLPQPLEFSGEL